ncbi:hypothetical protein LCGC14_1070430 [marine sediment metagenome]|uniref:Uncharacterized protein n=1 Tax=marine sediment metagenome TaxID=412755 RepID=A0A0F9Q1E5_9ZZZZ
MEVQSEMEMLERKVYDIVLRCLVFHPPKLIIFDDDIGGLGPMAQNNAGEILQEVTQFYHQLVGEIWIVTTLESEQLIQIANEAFVRSLGIDLGH